MKLYLDMDGVLTGFKTAVETLGAEATKGLSEDASEIQKQKMYDLIEAVGVKFWSTMPWATGGKQLWALVEPFRPVLLTSTGKFTFAKNGKLLWIKRNVPGTSVFFSDSKSEYVDPYETCILIDDMKNNIEGWKEMGGMGILHTSFEDTEKQLLTFLWDSPSEKEMALYKRSVG
jgi:hypothetical protein